MNTYQNWEDMTFNAFHLDSAEECERFLTKANALAESALLKIEENAQHTVNKTSSLLGRIRK